VGSTCVGIWSWRALPPTLRVRDNVHMDVRYGCGWQQSEIATAHFTMNRREGTRASNGTYRLAPMDNGGTMVTFRMALQIAASVRSTALREIVEGNPSICAAPHMPVARYQHKSNGNRDERRAGEERWSMHRNRSPQPAGQSARWRAARNRPQAQVEHDRTQCRAGSRGAVSDTIAGREECPCVKTHVQAPGTATPEKH